jgi:AcrR family transcriptional regulator
MVRSAAQLIRRKGVAGTGMREIVSEAAAPRGSLQHYFPAGKEGLVEEALTWMGGVAARRVRRQVARLEGAEDRAPSRLLAGLLDDWRRDLEMESFSAGCPLVAAAADVSATSDRLRRVTSTAFDSWQAALEEALLSLGVDPLKAPALALVVISSLEGAIVLARVRRDMVPFDALLAEVGPLLDAAVTER